MQIIILANSELHLQNQVYLHKCLREIQLKQIQARFQPKKVEFFQKVFFWKAVFIFRERQASSSNFKAGKSSQFIFGGRSSFSERSEFDFHSNFFSIIFWMFVF